MDATVPPALNVAVTVWPFPLAVSVHAPVPLHAPLHPANVEPVAGVAVNWTEAPLPKFALHIAPQVTPGGLLVTVPDPLPARVTVIEALELAGVNEPPEEEPPPHPDTKIPKSASRTLKK